MIKIAVCDDEQTDRERLLKWLRQYELEHSLRYGLCAFDRGEAFLQAIAKDPEIQIAFLDIYMKGLSGVDVAKAIRADHRDCAIVFTTTSRDHYAQSYEIDAEHYLVKPFDYTKVSQALARCETLLAQAARYVDFTYRNVCHHVLLRDIRYLEVFKNVSIIHAVQDIQIVSTLEAVMKQLGDARFVRCHKSFAVNLEEVSGIHNQQILLKDGSFIPYGRRFASAFEQAYGLYLTEKMIRG